MDNARADAMPDGVVAPLQFSLRTGDNHVALVKVEGEGLDERRGAFEYHDVAIANGRPRAERLDLNREGFVLRRYGTAVEDFYDTAEVRRVYYPEMEALIGEATGASKVVIFDHTIRVDNDALQTERKVRPPAAVVHNDFTEISAAQRVRDLMPADEAEHRLAKRFGSINVWRPVREPVQTAPLAICGYGDLADRDLVVAERHYPDGRIGRIYNIAYNPAQRWTYFPDMMRDEVVLLKCYDSLTDGTARWTAHGSFKDPTSHKGAAPRESIEIRSMIFFD